MKRSQIALLSVGGILAGIVIVSVVSARIALSHGGTEFLDTASIAGGAGLRGFDGVEVAGRWRVNVSRGDDWRVDLSYPEDLEDRIKVRLRGDRLWLGLTSGVPWNEPGFPVSADIVMPELEEVEVRGAAMVEVSGFRGRRLEIDIAGAARLEGRDGRYDETGNCPRRGCERHRPARHCGGPTPTLTLPAPRTSRLPWTAARCPAPWRAPGASSTTDRSLRNRFMLRVRPASSGRSE